MRLPDLDRRYIPQRKIVDYLLNIDHPQGGSKARFFLRFGFTFSAPAILRAALLQHPAMHEVTDVNVYGQDVRYGVEGALATPDGRDPQVRTVWRAPPEGGGPYLLTAFPAPRQR